MNSILEQAKHIQTSLKYFNELLTDKEQETEDGPRDVFLSCIVDGNTMRVIGSDIVDAIKRAEIKASSPNTTQYIKLLFQDNAIIVPAYHLNALAGLYKEDRFDLSICEPTFKEVERREAKYDDAGNRVTDELGYWVSEIVSETVEDQPKRLAISINGGRVKQTLFAQDQEEAAILNYLSDNMPGMGENEVIINGLGDGKVMLALSADVRAGLKGVKPSAVLRWGRNIGVQVRDLRAAMKDAILTAVILNENESQVMVINVNNKLLKAADNGAIEPGEMFNWSILPYADSKENECSVTVNTAGAQLYIERAGKAGDGYTAVNFTNYTDDTIQKVWGRVYFDGLTVKVIFTYEDGQTTTINGPVFVTQDVPQRKRVLMLASGEVETQPETTEQPAPAVVSLTLEDVLRVYFERKGVSGEAMLTLAGVMRDRWVARGGNARYFESLGYEVTVQDFETAVSAIWLSGDFFTKVTQPQPEPEAEPEPCQHPPTQLYSWVAEGAGGPVTVVCCKKCHQVLTGAATLA